MTLFRYAFLLSSLLTATVSNAFGQRKFAFSVNLAPVYTHSDFSTKIPSYSSSSPVTMTEFTSKANGLNYSIGLMGWYSVTPKWSASAGIWATHSILAKQNVNFDGVPSIVTYSYSHPFNHSFKVPLSINYQASLNRLSPYFSAGVSLDFRETAYIDINGTGDDVPVKFGKPVVVTPLVGAGLMYRLTNRTSLLVLPTFQYDLQTRPSYAYYHAYQLSLQTHLIWHL